MSAFEFYYGMGAERNITAVCKEFTVSRTTGHKWANSFNWNERAHLRDQHIASEVKKKIVDRTISLKAKRLQEISKIQVILDAAIQTAVGCLREKTLRAKTPADIRALVAAKEQMVRIEQSLIGEELDDEALSIRVRVVDEKD